MTNSSGVGLAKDAINRLAIVVVSPAQVGRLTQKLRQGSFYFTQAGSWGSLLEETTLCLLIGVAEARLPVLLDLIRECCHVYAQFIPARLDGALLLGQPLLIEAESGGAAVYVLDVERFVQL